MLTLVVWNTVFIRLLSYSIFCSVEHLADQRVDLTADQIVSSVIDMLVAKWARLRSR